MGSSSVATCPMCGSRLGRKQPVCTQCGFALPSHSGPVLGRPPESPPHPLPVDGVPPRYETRVPSTRETNKIVGLIIPVAALIVIAPGNAAIAFAVVVFTVLIVGIPSAWSLFGWEHVRAYDDRIEVRRVLFGRTLRSFVLPREAIVDIGFEQPASRFLRGRDRGELWTFFTGPVVITHVAGAFRIAEGYEYQPDDARDLAERLRSAMRISRTPPAAPPPTRA